MIVEIADCETDGLLDTMTRLWMLQIGRADSDEITIYADQPGFRPISEGIKRLKAADRIVGHNFCKFDHDAINMIYPGTIDLRKIWDTMVMGSLLDPSDKAVGLKDVGRKMGIEKGDHNDWSKFSHEMVTYGRQDIVVTRARYRQLEPQLRHFSDESKELEHLTAYVIGLQERNGFLLDQVAAVALEAELRQELADAESALQAAFPPIWVAAGKDALTVPKVNNNPPGVTKGCAYTKVKLQVFNAQSGHQVADRLKRKYGWRPKKFTPSGAPATDEEVINALPYPEAKVLGEYLKRAKRLSQLSDGKTGWLKVVHPDGRVRGRVNPNGAGTGRMTHSSPNMANVDKKEPRMRAVWIPRKGWKLVGTDAEGLEARMLAHYLAKYDGGEFADRVVNGDKSKGTDVHSVNLKAVKKLLSRDGAKTLLYALIYGAQDPKLGDTVKEDYRNNGKPVPKESSKQLGAEARRQLAHGMKGIDLLVEKLMRLWKKNVEVREITTKTGGIKRTIKVKRNWLPGLDGRRTYITATHTLLNYLLQGAGAMVMKKALVIFHFETCPRLSWNHGTDFGYCANVHDEVQVECRPEIAEEVGREFAAAIVEAGKRLGVRCPLAGDFTVGNNWKETH